MNEPVYELVLTRPARRAVTAFLPPSVAAAVIDFMTSTLIEQPDRVGAALRRDLVSIHSAHRGTYRTLYRVHPERHEVVVLRIEHRRGVYRGR